MSEVSIITNDEIMEMTQLVFDRYYTELKRQLRRAEIPAEQAEQYCTEILSKVYQALQTQGVAATSYEMDACAIPIINEEIRKILVPLHLNGYRNLRENPITEKQQEESILENENVVEDVAASNEAVAEVKNHEVTEIKKETVQVVSNGEVQVYPETAENELNPELRTEIRRILQQEFQLEPAQVKPVVVVVNVTAPQVTTQQEEKQTAQQEQKVEPAEPEQEEETSVAEVQEDEVKCEPVLPVEEGTKKQAWEQTVEVIEFEQGEERKYNIAASEIAATVNVGDVSKTQVSEQEPLPQLDFDIEKLVQEETPASNEEKKESRHLWLWIPIIALLLLLLWLTIGMLMSYGIVPEFNLGYEWFNETLFELF